MRNAVKKENRSGLCQSKLINPRTVILFGLGNAVDTIKLEKRVPWTFAIPEQLNKQAKYSFVHSTHTSRTATILPS